MAHRDRQERAREHEALLTRIEKEYGVDRHIMLGLWGMESAFGDVVDNPKHMKPVFPSLAALAWGEPRRRAYWEKELLNALVIAQRGWARPPEMIGSWAGAMGHTQWMPEVWLNMGVDFDRDGRISPFRPADALAGTARYLVQRGGYRRGEHWGYEVKLPERLSPRTRGERSVAAWARPRAECERQGFSASEGTGADLAARSARAGLPDYAQFPGGEVYNPSDLYTLAIVHLGDRIAERAFSRPFPGGERPLTWPNCRKCRRLTARGFDTALRRTHRPADHARGARFSGQAGLKPADGYAG